MPHAIIEYSENLHPAARPTDISRVVHEVMIKSGLFSTADIKTRAYAAQDFLVGEMGRQGSFIHITVCLLEGRTGMQKQSLSEALCDAMKTHAPIVNQLSVDIRDMVKESYRKHVVL